MAMTMAEKRVYDSRQITFHTPPLRARWLQQLIGASSQQEFLNHRWIVALLALTPRRYQPALARRILAQSPHYFIYQWSNLYEPGTPRRAILQMESDRNTRSRAEICDRLLRPLLHPEATVLDFGCGPGYLAREVSHHVRRVIACDISVGTIACAKTINSAPNIRYDVNGDDNLPAVPDASINVLYSVAVFQHLPKDRALPLMREFKRVLKPGGTALIHTILTQPNRQESHPDTMPWPQKRTALRLVMYNEAEWLDIADQAGFRRCAVHRIGDIAALNDDVGREHLVVVQV